MAHTTAQLPPSLGSLQKVMHKGQSAGARPQPRHRFQNLQGHLSLVSATPGDTKTLDCPAQALGRPWTLWDLTRRCFCRNLHLKES